MSHGGLGGPIEAVVTVASHDEASWVDGSIRGGGLFGLEESGGLAGGWDVMRVARRVSLTYGQTELRDVDKAIKVVMIPATVVDGVVSRANSEEALLR